MKMIRQARKEDAEAIVELFRTILIDTEHPIMNDFPWEALKPPLVEAALREDYIQSYHNALVKEINGEIADFCFSYDGQLIEKGIEPLGIVLKNYSLPDFRTLLKEESFAGEWYLDSLVTKPSFRGQGVGKALLNGTYDLARKSGFSKVGLNVDQSNPRALKLYRNQGFEKVGEVKLGDHMYDHMQKSVI